MNSSIWRQHHASVVTQQSVEHEPMGAISGGDQMVTRTSISIAARCIAARRTRRKREACTDVAATIRAKPSAYSDWRN